jgi:hypothetical protein
MGKRLFPLAIALLIAAAVVSVTQLASGERKTSAPRSSAAIPRAAGPSAAGSHARYVYLASQRSNRCDLQAGEIRTYLSGRHLQGACCSPMEETRYREQVAALRGYTAIPQIPRDPYDIPAALARELLRYDRTIQLTARERAIHQRALRASPEHGPCCCRCWRWNAFRGLSKHLIHERRWPAAQLGRLIGDLDGCGGAAGEDTAAPSAGRVGRAPP